MTDLRKEMPEKFKKFLETLNDGEVTELNSWFDKIFMAFNERMEDPASEYIGSPKMQFVKKGTLKLVQ